MVKGTAKLKRQQRLTSARASAEGYAMPSDEAIAFALAHFDTPPCGTAVNNH